MLVLNKELTLRILVNTKSSSNIYVLFFKHLLLVNIVQYYTTGLAPSLLTIRKESANNYI